MMAFNLKAAEYFIQKDQFQMKKTLDERYGYPSDTLVEEFQKEIEKIEKMASYSDFLKVVKWDTVVRGTFSLCGRFNDAKVDSDNRGYTRKPRITKDWGKIRTLNNVVPIMDHISNVWESDSGTTDTTEAGSAV